MTRQPTAYRFVQWEVPALDTLKKSREYILAMKWEHARSTLTRAEKDEIADWYINKRYVRLGGWAFLFPEMPTFYVEQYDSVRIVCAPDKTAVRNALYGRIDRITARP